MINANELRIGNNLTDHHIGSLITVVEVKENNTRCSYIRADNGQPHISIVNNEYLKPIPLTEEILLKCGFVNTDLGFVLITPNGTQFGLLGMRGKYSLGLSGPFGLVQPCFIEHLHQLQNLYFALSGQELVYTP